MTSAQIQDSSVNVSHKMVKVMKEVSADKEFKYPTNVDTSLSRLNNLISGYLLDVVRNAENKGIIKDAWINIQAGLDLLFNEMYRTDRDYSALADIMSCITWTASEVIEVHIPPLQYNSHELMDIDTDGATLMFELEKYLQMRMMQLLVTRLAEDAISNIASNVGIKPNPRPLSSTLVADKIQQALIRFMPGSDDIISVIERYGYERD